LTSVEILKGVLVFHHYR